MNRCIKMNIAGFDIKLDQHTNGKFRVTYGVQVNDNLTYTEGTNKLGEAIFHALACESKLDNGV